MWAHSIKEKHLLKKKLLGKAVETEHVGNLDTTLWFGSKLSFIYGLKHKNTV